MKVLKKEHENILQDGDIYYLVNRRSYKDSGDIKNDIILRNVLFILHYISSCQKTKLIRRIETPALTHIIREEIFNGDISRFEASNYARFIKSLVEYVGVI